MNLILLKDNPFYTLQLPTFAKKEDIFMAADVLSYKIGIDKAQEEFVNLANANKRLIAELNYLVGLDINTINNIIELIDISKTNKDLNKLEALLSKDLNLLCKINILKEYLLLNSLGNVSLNNEIIEYVTTTLKNILDDPSLNEKLYTIINDNKIKSNTQIVKDSIPIHNFINLLFDLIK